MVATAGCAWALFCALLARGGHAPSRSLLPIAREDYYHAQSLFVLPVLLGMWLGASLLVHAFARRLGGDGKFVGTLNGLGVALAAPLLGVLLLPDIGVYLGLGFASLGPLVRVTGPLAMLATLALAAAVIRSAHHVRSARAWGLSLVFVVLLGLLGGPFLR